MQSRGQEAEDKDLPVRGEGVFTKEDESRMEWHIDAEPGRGVALSCMLRRGDRATHLLGVVWICLGIESPRFGDVFRKLKGQVVHEALSRNYGSFVSGVESQAIILAYHSDMDQESV